MYQLMMTVLLGFNGEHLLRGCTWQLPRSLCYLFFRLIITVRDQSREAFETYIMERMRIKESFSMGLEEYPRP